MGHLFVYIGDLCEKELANLWAVLFNLCQASPWLNSMFSRLTSLAENFIPAHCVIPILFLLYLSLFFVGQFSACISDLINFNVLSISCMCSTTAIVIKEEAAVLAAPADEVLAEQPLDDHQAEPEGLNPQVLVNQTAASDNPAAEEEKLDGDTEHNH